MVPEMAMPVPEATSVAVSVGAAPMVVWFCGSPRSTFTAATTPTTRNPAASSTSASATQAMPGWLSRP